MCKYLVLQCYENTCSLNILARYLSNNWKTMPDIWHPTEGYIKWGISEYDDINFKKEVIRCEIARVLEYAKNKLENDEKMGNINNIVLFGKTKIDIVLLVNKPPYYKFSIE